MKINKLSLLAAAMYLFISGTALANHSTNKIAVIEIGGDLEGKTINAYINENRIIQTNGVSFRKTKRSQKVSIPVQSNSFELKISIGNLEYVFDVKSEQNTKCLFWKENEMVTFLSLPLDESSEHFEQPHVSTQSKVHLRITGAIRGKQLKLYAGSSLLIDELIDSEETPLAKFVNFSTTDSPFNIKVVIDEKSHSLDIDPNKGTYLDFFCLSERQVTLTQYLTQESLPKLY